jgi:hypothetical protein
MTGTGVFLLPIVTMSLDMTRRSDYLPESGGIDVLVTGLD